jgi:Secretion system C-terminal sorting domain
VPKELIKLDMTQSSNGFFDISNFSVTPSRKFLFTAIVGFHTGVTSYPIVGGQFVKQPIFLCCFSPTGSVLWRVENTNKYSKISGRPLLNETKGLIYACGSTNASVGGDTIQNIVFKNSFNPTVLRGVPFFIAVDTMGIVQFGKNGNGYKNGNSDLKNLAFRSDGRLFGYGDGGGVVWDGFNFYGGNNGYQTFMPSFDTATNTVLSMDSIKSSFGASNATCIVGDKNNNIYVGGTMANDVIVAGQTLQNYGGTTDFFVAKFGTTNSCILPLKMMGYKLLLVNDKQVQNNWTTASEVNVSRFNVQRSTNGKDFETVGVVMSKNKAANEYNFVDGIGNWALGISKVYYRIESVDYDGQKQYSEIRNVAFGVGHLALDVSIYPNPAKGMVHIDCVGAKEIKLIDMVGKEVEKYNNINHLSLNIHHYTKGLYIVQVIDKNNTIHTAKLVVE